MDTQQETIDVINSTLFSHYGRHVLSVATVRDGVWKIKLHLNNELADFPDWVGDECYFIEDILFRIFHLIWEDGRHNG